MWVYQQTQFGAYPLFTVGFYDPNGVWHTDSDHATADEAAERVHWLNGGNTDA